MQKRKFNGIFVIIENDMLQVSQYKTVYFLRY